jgi:threonine/homoserine/homoserine lactone efflux protein
MNFELYAAFLAATAILIAIPGPNVSLIVANSLAHGSRHALVTVAGTASAQAIQLTITCAGMTSLIVLLANWFEWLRWAGVVYLVYLGVREWRARDGSRETPRPAPSARRTFWQGFLVAATNPKVLLFYAAFLPQFVDPTLPPGPQFLALCIGFMAIAITIDSSYALAAGRIRALFSDSSRLRWKRRITGTLLIGAGLGLALARRQ